ncbi:MAG: aspartate/glutamate racemase family protein [Sedimentitalea sp.]
MKIWYQSYVDYENGATYWDALRVHLDQIAQPGTQIDIRGITPFDSYAHPLVEFRCAREMITNAVQAEREGYDAVIVGHIQDSGLYEARAAVDIPIIALGEATMLYCCQMGQKIGIVTINPRFIPGFHHQIGKYGLRERVTGIHSMTFEPGQILDAYNDETKAAEVLALFEEQALPLVAQGVDVLIPGGGIPMLLFARTRDHFVGQTPVINGIPIAVKMAEMMVSMRQLTGQFISRTSDYAKVPDHVIEEFITHPKGL